MSAKAETAKGQAAGDSVSDDRLLGGRVILRQPVAGYRVAIDPVFLAAAVPTQTDERVLDLGCGVGAAALCLLARQRDVSVTGLELQPRLAALARDNAKLNGVTETFEIEEGDAFDPPGALARGSFDQVMVNPPHLDPATGTTSRDPVRRLANAEASKDGGLAGWIAAAAGFLRRKGRLTVVHRADRIDTLLAALVTAGCGETVVFPLWPARGKPARRVIVTARKEVRAPGRIAPGLVLHRADGTFTRAAEAVLSAPKNLRL